MKKLFLIFLLFIGFYSIGNNNNYLPNFLNSTQLHASSSYNSNTKKNAFHLSEDVRTERFNHLVSLLSIALIAILTLLCLALYKNNSVEYKSNKLLHEKNKELEKEKIKSENAIQAKNDFLATISHEIKTPLNAINILSEILIDEDPNENQKEYLVSLKISANYLMNLINDVLQINKMEDSNFKVEKIEFNIREKIEDINKALYEIAKQNNVKCITKIDSDIPEKLIGDATKLSQILINLISNAIKFSENGNVSTNVFLLNNGTEDCKIKFEVIDDGIGIPVEQQELIFENFTQGSSEITKQFGGTGLGLTIVKRLLESLGGTIHLDSEENVGSNFNFELIFEKNFNPIEIKDSLNYSKIEGKKILIVEDNSITKVITQKLIEKHKGITTIASTGKEALEECKNNKFDLIIMDINLPDINGDEVSVEIRKFDLKTPIIAFTAIHGEDCVKHISSKGMNAYITKPVDITMFYEKIIDLLSVKN